MGIQFKPSEAVKSNGEKSNGENQLDEKLDLDKYDLSNLENYKISAPEIPVTMPELMFSNTEHIETISLPPLAPKKTTKKSTLREFCQHLNGMTPGKHLQYDIELGRIFTMTIRLLDVRLIGSVRMRHATLLGHHSI